MTSYTEADIQNALQDVLNGQSFKAASRDHGIPRTTLRRRSLGTQSAKAAHENQQRLSSVQEESLVMWILRQEGLGYAPTHAQICSIASTMLKLQSDYRPLGKRWSTAFIQRYSCIKTKLGHRTDWQRVNATSPANINKLFDLYETMSWIPPNRRYNADEGGIMEGQGVNGLVVGSSQSQVGQVPVKANISRSWTSIIECVSATGSALSPLVIFKAKSIQDQWFKDEFLKHHPAWQVAFSENGWTSNDIALEWLEKIFLPETEPRDPCQARLLIVDGHGSHTTDEFMTKCFLSNVYLLFLPAHTSHVTQPLDLGCFSSLKAAYRRLVGDFTALTDETKIGKARFLEFYAEAHDNAFSKPNIQSGWKATGLYPKNRLKALSNRWVVTRRTPTPPPQTDGDISTPTKSLDVIKILRSEMRSPHTRQAFRKVSIAIDKLNIELALKDREIASLRARLEQLQAPKWRKIRQDPNERFVSLAEVALKCGQVVEERTSRESSCILVAEEEEEESEEEAPRRRSKRVKRH